MAAVRADALRMLARAGLEIPHSPTLDAAVEGSARDEAHPAALRPNIIPGG
jgi:hypothetical protein